jgi:glutathione S-transferase
VYAFSYYVHPVGAAVLGALYSIGRLAYGIGYKADSEKRTVGFMISFLANTVLFLGSAGGAVYHLYRTRP